MTLAPNAFVMTRLRVAAFGSLLVLGACAGTQATTPRSRVAKDLGCTTEGTTVEEIAPVPGEKAARWQVTGCGRSAVYLCTTPVRECWREGEARPTAP
jgi:hypothetical protein